jgi:hypothetical protein
MDDKFNQSMVGGDKDVIKLARERHKVTMNFKAKGSPELRGSITYRKGFFDQFRRVYDSK